MKKFIYTLIFFLLAITAYSQSYNTFNSTLRLLFQPSTQQTTFDQLANDHKIPFIEEDSVAFLYQGAATSVQWMGDFNGWGYDKKFDNKGKRIGNSDLWILRCAFKKDARLDYKILINETQWILDPHNPHHQWSGVGGGSPNSELRMPDWKQEEETRTKPSAHQGKLIKDILIQSNTLGYQIMYSVYLPYGYSTTIEYPVLYTTDGYEYLHENMGNITSTLNNLISEGKIKPIVAVFVDHREPINRSNNKRMTELALNDKYLHFFADELLPTIEKKYAVGKRPDQRAILGTSMGGLTAAYFSFSRPDLFGLAGIQSPSFWFRPEIYTLCDNPEKPPVKVYMTTGTINDTAEGTLKMKNILDKNMCTYQFKEVNQGHSWGNWRDQLDDILLYFFPAN